MLVRVFLIQKSHRVWLDIDANKALPEGHPARGLREQYRAIAVDYMNNLMYDEAGDLCDDAAARAGDDDRRQPLQESDSKPAEVPQVGLEKSGSRRFDSEATCLGMSKE